MTKLYKEELEIIIRQIADYQKRHPKAEVFYNVQARAIQITYPLPKDFYKLENKAKTK